MLFILANTESCNQGFCHIIPALHRGGGVIQRRFAEIRKYGKIKPGIPGISDEKKGTLLSWRAISDHNCQGASLLRAEDIIDRAGLATDSHRNIEQKPAALPKAVPGLSFPAKTLKERIDKIPAERLSADLSFTICGAGDTILLDDSGDCRWDWHSARDSRILSDPEHRKDSFLPSNGHTVCR